jgi:hypothetical protein
VSSGRSRVPRPNCPAHFDEHMRTCSPRVISHSHPPASTPVRACLRRPALISQLTKRRLVPVGRSPIRQLLGQQKVNNAAPGYPKAPELVSLDHADGATFPSVHERPASTLNPKVEGSNPSRPIENCLQMGRFAESEIRGRRRKVNTPLLTRAQ